jgi:hypothetical protein
VRPALAAFDWRVAAFAAVVLFVCRPAVLLAVLSRFRIPIQDKLLAAWHGPRGLNSILLALVVLAGIALVLWTPAYAHLLRDRFVSWDALLIAVLAFIGGGIYGAAVYWAGGLILYAGGTLLRSRASYRQARHVLAFSAAPVALSLVLVWPLRLAVYGEDVFRSGGSDHGAGNSAFVVLETAFVVWALVLLAVGVRVVFSKASSSSAGIS